MSGGARVLPRQRGKANDIQQCRPASSGSRTAPCRADVQSDSHDVNQGIFFNGITDWASSPRRRPRRWGDPERNRTVLSTQRGTAPMWSTRRRNLHQYHEDHPATLSVAQFRRRSNLKRTAFGRGDVTRLGGLWELHHHKHPEYRTECRSLMRNMAATPCWCHEPGALALA